MFRVSPGRIPCSFFLSLGLAFLVGCASTGRVQQQLAQQTLLGDYAAALQTIESERNRSYRGKNRLLYYLDRGMLLHLDGQYAESNASFEEAKRIGNELYTKSLSSEGISLMTNDYVLDYAGENFERTMIHLFAALNYSMLDEPDAALVEIRQVGEYLRKLQIDSPNENVYQEDAFARYLSALFYESAGEYDAALVDYKKAIAAYADYATDFAVSPPATLFSDAARVASRLGDWARADLARLGSVASARVIPEGSGELVLLHYNGLSPVKGETRISIPFSEAWLLVAALQVASDRQARAQIERATTVVSAIRGVDLVSVAFPKYVDRPYSIARMEPRAASATRIEGPFLVEDVGAIAEKDLEDRKARIYTKTVARAAIKFAIQKSLEIAARQAGKDEGALLQAGTQILGNIARYASEQADKRVWSTLPDEIWMSSVVLPAGTHEIEVDFLSARSAVVESRALPPIEIGAGERRFYVLRTVR